MSWIDRMLNERLEQAARNGELEVPELAGKPIADLDRQRPQGWWADQFVARERSADVLAEAHDFARSATARFWRAPDRSKLHELVTDANERLSTFNDRMLASDRIDLFDAGDVERRWHRTRR